MDLAVARLSGDHVGEELDEGRAGMPRHRLPDNFAGAGVERREQREGAVPVVLESVTLGATRRQRQNGIESVERLNRRLFIDREDGGMARRVQIQPQDVRRLSLKIRIIREHVALESMRLEASPSPDAGHQHMTDAEDAGQFARAPVRAAVGRPLPSLLENAGFHRRRPDRGRLAAILGAEAVQPIRLEAPFPAADVIRVARESRADRAIRFARREHQDDARPAGVLSANLATTNTAFQLLAFIGSQRQRHMARQSTGPNSVGTSH